MEEKEALIILNSVEGVGAIKLRSLRENFGCFAKICSKSEEELSKTQGIGRKIAASIRRAFKEFDLKKELRLIKDNSVSVIALEEDCYPKNLKEIYDPPCLLYVKGNIKIEDKNSLAIVGSRRASYYGLSNAEKFGFRLASCGITIVSGLARGVDTQAHKGALKARGRTLAVLGSGLGNIYPEENIKLADDISESGALISEFPMERTPFKQNFPRRNRVISGLSLGVIVVEAARRSGALITADFALQEGREVFALPGKVDSATSCGTHSLIKEGAKLITSIEDIFEELNLDIEVRGEENIETQARTILEDEEKAVYDILKDEPLHIDELLEYSKMTICGLSQILLKLELKGLIVQFPGKKFARK